MGSAPSTPNRESSDNTSDNPWWQIENQILELNPNNNSTMDGTSSDDPNSNSSNRSELDQQQHESQIVESEAATSISNNLECENNDADGNESGATASSLNENEHSENGVVESDCSSSDAGANIEMNSHSERGHSNERQQSLEEFKEELRVKREMRTNAIVELRSELSSLRQQLAHEKEKNKQLIDERSKENLCEICNSIYKSLEQHSDNSEVVVVNAECASVATINTLGYSENGNIGPIRIDAKTNYTTTASNVTLRSQLAEDQFALQNANAEILRISSELAATRQQAKSLKEVIKMSKEIIGIRETELSQVK